MNNRNSLRRRRVANGLTLIELLVALSIISVLTALLIPKIRLINKDRGIRESARVVGSMFAKVVNRAQSEEMAGVLIERNPSFVDGSGVLWAGTTMYVLRSLPPYIGDFTGAQATVISTTATTMVVDIPMPLEYIDSQPPEHRLIQVNDTIRLNHGSVHYQVIGIANNGTALRLTLALGLSSQFGNAPFVSRPTLNVTAGTGVPFVVYRKPRRLLSSRIDLPEGYVLDLRFSGPLDNATGTVFNQSFDAPPLPDYDTIEIMFDGNGGLERVYYSERDTGDPTLRVRQGFPPTDSLYMLIADLSAANDQLPLYNPNNMWVSLDATMGSVNVAYNAPPAVGASLREQILFARSFARNRISAYQ